MAALLHDDAGCRYKQCPTAVLARVALVPTVRQRAAPHEPGKKHSDTKIKITLKHTRR